MSREADPQGASTGEFGVQMRTRDMARLALLYLRGGEWNGRQLVSRDWVARVFAPTVSMGKGSARYADQWWSMLERGVFMAVGFHRQILLVMPSTVLRQRLPGASNGPLRPGWICWIARPKPLLPFQPASPARPVPLLRDERKLQPSAAWVPTTTDCGPSPAGCEIRSSMMKVR